MNQWVNCHESSLLASRCCLRVGDYEAAYNYLREKFQLWNQIQGPHLENYVNPRGRSGIAGEFQHDVTQISRSVCPFIKEVGYEQSKSLIAKAAEGLAGWFFSFPIRSTADIILGALMDVCGYKKQGNRLMEKSF